MGALHMQNDEKYPERVYQPLGVTLKCWSTPGENISLTKNVLIFIICIKMVNEQFFKVAIRPQCPVNHD